MKYLDLPLGVSTKLYFLFMPPLSEYSDIDLAIITNIKIKRGNLYQLLRVTTFFSPWHSILHW